ncbi:hypothetical protein GCM10007140_10670 [Priestia taiwanensis]|uniref:Uncharacterized protein n=1 Tax=Priestia taiwanensis TaxID=1347902 RepID=A0A917AP09_9BACI|nr:hypothetical protein GCM10007140_10670 [Priestia taiwanensis]
MFGEPVSFDGTLKQFTLTVRKKTIDVEPFDYDYATVKPLLKKYRIPIYCRTSIVDNRRRNEERKVYAITFRVDYADIK